MVRVRSVVAVVPDHRGAGPRAHVPQRLPVVEPVRRGDVRRRRDPSTGRGSFAPWLGRCTIRTVRRRGRRSCARRWSPCSPTSRTSALLVGFDGGSSHDGTFRLRAGPEGPSGRGGGVPRRRGAGDDRRARELHGFSVDAGTRPRRAARAVGRPRSGGPSAPAPTRRTRSGWCSWYHYFGDVTEADLRVEPGARRRLALRRLPARRRLPADDRRLAHTNDKFPSDARRARVATSPPPAVGPGIWLAPFLAAPDSHGRAEHPDWIARYGAATGRSSACGNPDWGGGRPTCLDTTQPGGARPPRAARRATLVEAGFTYLKLDFTFAPAIDGRVRRPDAARRPSGCGPATTPIRRGAGDDTFLLGCGAPLGSLVGVVDGMRIGPDVAPHWCLPRRPVPARLATQPASRRPSTRGATRSPASFMHRRLWLNDPDCVMLRRDRRPSSTTAAIDTWAMRSACPAAWRWCPTTSRCSTPMRVVASTR